MSKQNQSTTVNDFEEGFQSPDIHLSSVDGNIFEEFLENYTKGASPRGLVEKGH